MKRLLNLIVVSALLVTACSSDEPSATSLASTSTVPITTTTTVPPTTSIIPPPNAVVDTIEISAPAAAVEVIDDAAADFEAATGIEISVTPADTDAVLAQLLADPTAGPDVFIGPHRWLLTLTEAGVAEPLTGRSEVVAGALAAVTLRGTVHALPVGLDTVVQFRNTALLPVAPNGVESLVDGCPLGEDESGPCLLIPLDSVAGHYPFLVSAGGYVFGDDPFDGWDAGDIGVDSNEALAGVALLETLVDADVTIGDGRSSVTERFADDVAPLLWGGLEELAALDQLGASYVVESLPPISGAPARAPLDVTAVWVNAFSPAKQQAVEFVVNHLGDPSVADELAMALRLAPVNVGFDGDRDLSPFVEGARVGDPVPSIFQSDFAWEQLAAAFSLIRSGNDPTEVLSDAAAEIRNAPVPEPPPEEDD